MNKLPDWLRDKLASPPTAGDGIHGWLFSVARQLHAHMDAAAIEAALTGATAGCTRRVTTREIRDAVQNSHAVAWQRGGSVRGGERAITVRPSRGPCNAMPTPDLTASDWPKPDAAAREMRLRETANELGGLVDLWEKSPVRHGVTSADDWLDLLLPDAEWLCLATDHPATARSRKRGKWMFGPADECGLVVPSPMTGPSGKRQDGQISHRCYENTGARRWLVIEFDSGAIDEQAALHWHLRTAAAAAGWPALRLVVHSGGKSLHGWYGPVADEEAARELMGYAIGLGADLATWTRCQLVRLPGGSRSIGNPIDVSLPDGFEMPGGRVRLEVFFYESEGLSQHFLLPIIS